MQNGKWYETQTTLIHTFLLNNVTKIGNCRINKIRPSTLIKLPVIIIILYEITVFIVIYVITVFITQSFVSH